MFYLSCILPWMKSMMTYYFRYTDLKYYLIIFALQITWYIKSHCSFKSFRFCGLTHHSSFRGTRKSWLATKKLQICELWAQGHIGHLKCFKGGPISSSTPSALSLLQFSLSPFYLGIGGAPTGPNWGCGLPSAQWGLILQKFPKIATSTLKQ